MVQFSRSEAACRHRCLLSANLGPVGPREPILVKMGDKRMIASYVPNGVQVVLLCGFKGDMLTVLNRSEVMTHAGNNVGE